MANSSHPFGFRPSRYLDGSPWSGKSQAYAFSASQANNCYIGDVVAFDATNRSTALTDPYLPGIPLILPKVAAMTTAVFRGIVIGFVPQPEFNQTTTASLGLRYRVASTARYGWVVEDPAVVFQVQETGNSYTTAASNGLNQTADISYTAGSTVTGIAGVALDGTTFQTSAVMPWRAVRYSQNVDNFNFTAADASTYARWDVIIANSDLANANKGA
jgi:hypothetical protein